MILWLEHKWGHPLYSGSDRSCSDYTAAFLSAVNKSPTASVKSSLKSHSSTTPCPGVGGIYQCLCLHSYNSDDIAGDPNSLLKTLSMVGRCFWSALPKLIFLSGHQECEPLGILHASLLPSSCIPPLHPVPQVTAHDSPAHRSPCPMIIWFKIATPHPSSLSEPLSCFNLLLITYAWVFIY